MAYIYCTQWDFLAGGHFMKQVNSETLKKLQSGIPLKVRKGHTVRLETTQDPLTVHTGVSLLYAMAGSSEIPRILDEHIQVKERERGYPESEHILALAAMRLSAEILSMIWRPCRKTW